jgi:putative PEP-CTERM system histidine kinase
MLDLRHLKVVLRKRFARFKYDYREEWLRLIDNLSSTASPLPLPERAVMALAEIIESPGGLLFVQEHDHSVYVPAASWSKQDNDTTIPWQELPRDTLMAHMESNAWILDSDEPLPAGTGKHFLARLAEYLQFSVLVVPLLLKDKLFGFAILRKKRTGDRLTYEDIDLLRTSGRQVASYLAQHYVSQRLAEAQQFETYGRMTAFLMHDLKNIIAQQTLLVHNAARHRHKPEFIDDAVATIGASVERMNRTLKQLRFRADTSKPQIADVREIIADAVERCRVFTPAPELELPETGIGVLADAERLTFGITNLIRNAQQATSFGGSVRVGLRIEQNQVLVEVADDGPGMTDSFVRYRLFRPFDSTSPEAGMGIGAFQLRETVRAIGGTVTVQTGEGRGSCFQIRLPLSNAPLG